MSQRNLIDEFWSIATNLHIGLLKRLSASDFYQVLLEAKKQSIPFSWRDIDSIIRKTNQSDILSIPNRVIDFIASYCQQIGGETVLDPWANIGVLLLALQEKMQVKSTALMRRLEDIQIAELFDPKDIQWHLKSNEQEIEISQNQFDLIISVPAFGLPSQKKSYSLPEGTLQLQDSVTYLHMISACQQLSQKGKAVFLLPESFYGHDRMDSVINNLGEFGLHINAIISLPSNMLQPATSVNTALFFISREETSDLFIGHLSDVVDENSLLKNLIQRKKGAILETGYLVTNPEEYKSWRQYSLLVEIQEIVKHSKLPIVKLEEIAIKFDFAKKGEDIGFEEIPNSFFLPLMEHLPIALDSADITNPSHYVQVILKPELALADYVAGYFGTEAGKKVMASLASGNVITKISKLDLFDALVLLPEIEVQQKVIEIHRAMRELSFQLQKFEKALFKRPDQAEKLRKDIQKLDQKESFENWVESLPFPIASILWHYHASVDVDKKLEHLLQFFEATAEFVAIILLSAYLSDQNFLSKFRELVFQKSEKASITRSSFGYWVTTIRKLAKPIRKMLGNSNERSICFELFRTNSEEFIQTITSKELVGILNRAAEIRNRDAHSGIRGDLSNNKRLNLAESELDKLRALFVSTFDEIIMFSSLNNQYKEGIFTNKITKLKGFHPRFVEDYVKTIIPLDSEKLYLSEKQERKPLELLPFIKMVKSPDNEKTACYFYSRMEGQTLSWVSYHYEGQPEIEMEDKELLKIIKLFEN